MPLYLGVFCSRILGFFFSDIFVFFKLSVCFVCFFLISILWYILTLNIHICCMKNYWKQIPVNISYLWIGKFSPFPFLFFFLINLFIYLFLSALGLHCCAQAFSSCGEQGLLFVAVAQASHCRGFSCCRAWALGKRASVVVAHRL